MSLVTPNESNRRMQKSETDISRRTNSVHDMELNAAKEWCHVHPPCHMQMPFIRPPLIFETDCLEATSRVCFVRQFTLAMQFI